MSFFQMLLAGGGSAAVGQQVFTSSESWVVPAGVTEFSCVCVQQSYDTGADNTIGSAVAIGATTYCRAINSVSAVGDGGGDGAVGSAALLWDFDGDNGIYWYSGGGGGGAGGYSATGNSSSGGSGSNGQTFASDVGGQGGGGVGLLGTGSSGSANSGTGGSGGANGSSFSGGTGGAGGSYGGGRGGNAVVTVGAVGNPGRNGGALRYTNNIPCTPGQTVTITVTATSGANGAVRIMWGGGRSYPSNAGNL